MVVPEAAPVGVRSVRGGRREEVAVGLAAVAGSGCLVCCWRRKWREVAPRRGMEVGWVMSWIRIWMLAVLIDLVPSPLLVRRVVILVLLVLPVLQRPRIIRQIKCFHRYVRSFPLHRPSFPLSFPIIHCMWPERRRLNVLVRVREKLTGSGLRRLRIARIAGAILFVFEADIRCGGH